MASDSWTRYSTSSSRRFQSRNDAYHLEEENEGNDEMRPEFLCPFCAEDFDIIGLCCHIEEEHTVEAKNGVCPVCAKRVGMDLVSHLTLQHKSLLKVQRKRRFRKGGSNSTLSILKKELREGNLQSLFGGSSYLVSSSNTDPDPLLSTFMCNPSVVDEPNILELPPPAEEHPVVENTVKESPVRKIEHSPISDKDHQEKVRKNEFVQGLLLSTFLVDDL